LKNLYYKNMKRKSVLYLLSVCILTLCVLLNILLPFSNGKMKTIKDKNGKVVAGSISEKVWIDADTAKLGLIIKSADIHNPVLLLLGGGPGIPEYILEDEYGSNLEQYFTVCYMNYRGAGLSYDPSLDKTSLTSDTYFADAVRVTQYLRRRFAKDKIYLMGHSFGTYVGLNVVSRNPELYKAYFAMSMITNQRESEKRAFAYMLSTYEKEHNRARVKNLEKYAQVFSGNKPINFSDPLTAAYFSKIRDSYMHDLGIGTTHTMKSVIPGIFFPSLRMKEFTPEERINIWKGKVFTAGIPVSSDSFNFNGFEKIRKISVPLYVFAGAYDYTTEYALQKDYFTVLDAPVKRFYTFSNSAHSPLFEENGRAVQLLLEAVRDGE